ncbi:MAG: hypothetical protein CMN41_07550 [SAR116 cluster bacterium]|nr:hypothetical protein [SAR116 cluster bacterium]|tara:strand:+ start:219 stop:410 length:192 start_codon:yes stop_codon:yes gene_type:complete
MNPCWQAIKTDSTANQIACRAPVSWADALHPIRFGSTKSSVIVYVFKCAPEGTSTAFDGHGVE